MKRFRLTQGGIIVNTCHMILHQGCHIRLTRILQCCLGINHRDIIADSVGILIFSQTNFLSGKPQRFTRGFDLLGRRSSMFAMPDGHPPLPVFAYHRYSVWAWVFRLCCCRISPSMAPPSKIGILILTAIWAALWAYLFGSTADCP